MAEAQDSLDVSDLKENFLECSVCLEHFDQAERRPRLLVNCLHSFCSQCLEQLLKKEGRGQITCPNCRQVQKVKGNAQSLPVDPVRNKLVDYVKFKKGKQILCTDCPDGSHAVARCHECQSYMCAPCKEAHHRNRLSRKHTCQSLEEALSEPVKNFLSHRCEDHPDYKIEFYCGKCSSLCCVSCPIVKHRGHILDPIEDAANSMLSSLKTKMEDVEKSAAILRGKKNSLDQESKMQKVNLKHATASINLMFDELNGKLNCQRNKLITELKERTESTVNGLKKQREATEGSLAQMESTLEYFKQMESKSDDCEVLSAGPVLVQSMEAAAAVDLTQDVKHPTWLCSRGEMDNVISSVQRIGVIHSDTMLMQCRNKENQKQITPSDSQNTFVVGCLEVKVYQTDMTKLPIDAIVNAANGNLSHGSGVARAISKAAGQKLENQGRRYVHQNGKIPVTGVIPTTAGDMPCKMVLHAVGPAWYDYKQSEKQQCIEDLCKTIMRCLIVANKERAECIAIPAISSGLFQVPVDQCCQAYVRGTRLFAESVVGKIHLKEVHFVDVKDDMVDNIKIAFSTLRALPLNATREEEKFLKFYMPTLSPNQGFSSQSHIKQEKSLEVTNTRFQRHTYRVGKEGTVKLYPFDLEKSSTDAIICWNDSQMRPLTSASEAVKSAAGQFKINKKTYEINFLDAFLGDPGNLDVKCLIHCIVPVHSLNIQDVIKLLKTTINIGTFNTQVDSLSMACFTNATVVHKEFCEALCVALEECLDSDDKVPEIHVVDADASVVATMKNVFDEKLRFEMSEDIKHANAALKEAEESDKCPICMDGMKIPKRLKCGHSFCLHCIDRHFEVNKPDCPSCGTVHGKVYGNMPAGSMNVVKHYGSLPGYTGDRFEIIYTFQSGYQGSKHPDEGKRYRGISRTAFLPKNSEGETVLRLLKVAFHRRLTFTICRSTTTGKEGVITWNDIHHKTSDTYGGNFGYPDPGYFDRVKGELKAKGITEDDIDWNEPLEGIIFSPE